MQAEDGFEQLGASRADEAEEADDFTSGDGQANVVKVRQSREVDDRLIVRLRTFVLRRRRSGSERSPDAGRSLPTIALTMSLVLDVWLS